MPPPPPNPENGLLLRSDLHKLFDQAYVTVDADALKVVVSNRIREEFEKWCVIRKESTGRGRICRAAESATGLRPRVINVSLSPYSIDIRLMRMTSCFKGSRRKKIDCSTP